MDFARELDLVLPAAVPNRATLIEKASRHLALIVEANEYMNLTRITEAREAAIKHVYDSVAPWNLFSEAGWVVDAGTGAGFPGIPLSIVLPEVKFTLAESVQKKARFVDQVVDALDIRNAEVFADRAESLPSERQPQVIAARAVAPLPRLIDLFRKPLRRGVRLLLYKGPDAESEIREASLRGLKATVASSYDLPYGMGQRRLIEVRRADC